MAPYIFNLFAEALHWIIQHHIPAALHHYLDDFLLNFSPDTPLLTCYAAVEWVMALGSQLGLNFQVLKTVWPTCIIEFLGIILDSISMEAHLPEDKLCYLQDLLKSWEKKKSVVLQEVEELSGFLQFCSQVIPQSKPFLCHLFDFQSWFQSPFSHLHILSGIKSDIAWWLVFSMHWNGICILQPSHPLVELFTDASGKKGLGGVLDHCWFASHIARQFCNCDIQFKELYAILQAILHWGNEWSGHHVKFQCDNQGDVIPRTQLLSYTLFSC
jgi:hypothetical protein